MDADLLSCLLGGEMGHETRVPHLLSHAITSCYNISVSLGTYYYNTLVFVNNFFVWIIEAKETKTEHAQTVQTHTLAGWFRNSRVNAKKPPPRMWRRGGFVFMGYSLAELLLKLGQRSIDLVHLVLDVLDLLVHVLRQTG